MGQLLICLHYKVDVMFWLYWMHDEMFGMCWLLSYHYPLSTGAAHNVLLLKLPSLLQWLLCMWLSIYRTVPHPSTSQVNKAMSLLYSFLLMQEHPWMCKWMWVFFRLDRTTRYIYTVLITARKRKVTLYWLKSVWVVKTPLIAEAWLFTVPISFKVCNGHHAS